MTKPGKEESDDDEIILLGVKQPEDDDMKPLDVARKKVKIEWPRSPALVSWKPEITGKHLDEIKRLYRDFVVEGGGLASK